MAKSIHLSQTTSNNRVQNPIVLDVRHDAVLHPAAAGTAHGLSSWHRIGGLPQPRDPLLPPYTVKVVLHIRDTQLAMRQKADNRLPTEWPTSRDSDRVGPFKRKICTLSPRSCTDWKLYCLNSNVRQGRRILLARVQDLYRPSSSQKFSLWTRHDLSNELCSVWRVCE